MAMKSIHPAVKDEIQRVKRLQNSPREAGQDGKTRLRDRHINFPSSPKMHRK
jgi:hypothetical protein